MSTKSPIIDFPAQVSLNEQGEEFFSRMGVPLKSVTGMSGRKRLGFQANSLEAPFMKILLRQNYFEEIYGVAHTLVQKRKELLDITKLIYYGIIYNKLRPHLSEVLLSSDLIERFNRKNPTHKITHDTKFNEHKIKSFFVQRKSLISKLINHILVKPFKIIEEDEDIKEKDEKRNIMKRFVEHISLKEWFLFFLITNGQEERESIVSRISELMLRYLEKTKIADYLGFLMMELIQNSEKATFVKAIKMKKISENPEEFLQDAQNREMVGELVRQMNYHIEVSWRVIYLKAPGNLHPIRYEIMVSNKGVIPKELRKKVKEKSQTEVKGVSLAQFYQESGQILGAGLGLFYMSYIQDESKKQGIRFDSTIESDDEKDKTYVILRVTM